jgi:magnesium-transporting ATPase (P-type)
MLENYSMLSPQETLSRLGSSENGLTPAAVAERRKKFGPNEIKKEKKFLALRIFISQFLNQLSTFFFSQ